MTTDPSGSAGSTDESGIEVPEHDRVEQQQPAGPDTEIARTPSAEHAVPEASEGDLAEQAIEVPHDEDDER